MNLVSILSLGEAISNKLPKPHAGYVYYPESDYRCAQCWKFIPTQQRCAELGLFDVVRTNGTCTLWSFGTPRPGLTPLGVYTKVDTAYTEDPKGTKCKNCINFRAPYCVKVDNLSPGATPGRIDALACCNLQEPR